MRILILASVFVLLLLGYKVVVEDDAVPLEEDDLRTVLKTETYQTRKLKASFEQILPKVNGIWVKELPAGPNMVMINQEGGQEMDPSDAMDRASNLVSRDPIEGITFLRWCLFMSNFSASDKELIFDKVAPKLSSTELMLMSQAIMSQQAEPPLFERALGIYTQNMNQAQAEQFLQDQWPKTTDAALQGILSSFAQSHGLPLPE